MSIRKGVVTIIKNISFVDYTINWQTMLYTLLLINVDEMNNNNNKHICKSCHDKQRRAVTSPKCSRVIVWRRYWINESWGEIWIHRQRLMWLQYEEDCSRRPAQQHRKNDLRWRCEHEAERTLAFPTIVAFVKSCDLLADCGGRPEMTARELSTSEEQSCMLSRAQLVTSEVSAAATGREFVLELATRLWLGYSECAVALIMLFCSHHTKQRCSNQVEIPLILQATVRATWEDSRCLTCHSARMWKLHARHIALTCPSKDSWLFKITSSDWVRTKSADRLQRQGRIWWWLLYTSLLMCSD